MQISSKPFMLVPWVDSLSMGPESRNSVTPKVTASATAQSVPRYRFPETAMPQSITGIILKLFPSICTGKLTYFRASYWQELASTLEKEIATYFQRGAVFLGDSPFP